jgi:hypothetical protein
MRRKYATGIFEIGGNFCVKNVESELSDLEQQH